MFGATVHKGFQEKKLFATVSLANVIVHEKYDNETTANDIALIKLHIPVPLNKIKNSKKEIK
jgi:secreted trypsin-like serine protease